MDRKQHVRLRKYYRIAEDLKTQIENLEGLIRAINQRAKAQRDRGHLRVSLAGEDVYRDRSWWGTITVAVARDAIVPALKVKLIELRKEYRGLPAAAIKYDMGADLKP